MFKFKPTNQPTSSVYSPVFGMKQRNLSSQELKGMNKVSIGYELTSDYHLALLKATLVAAGGEVIEIDDSQESKEQSISVTPFVRDPAIMLHDKNLIIYTKGNLHYGAMDIIHKAQEKLGFTPIEIDDAYFEGGNVFYAPQKSVLLHGVNPVGRYEAFSASSYASSYRVRCYKKEPVETNKHLADKLNQYGVEVVGLGLNPKVIDAGPIAGQLQRYYYYHLDCFLQLLPDGRLLILNKEILSDESQKKLQEVFGENFIDLAYPDYLTNPCLLNFIAVRKEIGQTTLVCPQLPPLVLGALSKLSLSVVTPNSLDPRDPAYDRELCLRVAAALQQDGFETMDATNLTTHLAKNTNGYLINDGRKESSVLRDIALGAYAVPIDQYYSEQKVTFLYGAGGPHCLTSEIVPSSFIGNKQVSVAVVTTVEDNVLGDSGEVSIATSAHGLFSKHHKVELTQSQVLDYGAVVEQQTANNSSSVFD